MKVYYLNDEHKPVRIQVNHQLQPVPHNPYGEPKIEYFTLQPGEGKMFDVDAPEGAIPWVKRWETRIVLLSYIQQDALELLQKSSSR